MPQITINNISLHYNVKGKGHPLIFIHAVGMDSSSWNTQTAFFSKNYQVITYDVRGHGLSGTPQRDYTMDDCANDLQQLLNRLGIQKAYLAGSSMGGYIALSYALRCPERVAALILAGTNYGPMTDAAVKLADEMAEKIKSMKSGAKSLNFMRAYQASTTRTDLTKRLVEVSQPVLIIVGERDKATPDFVSEAMHSKIANSQLNIVNDCGHLCHQDQPEIFNSILSKFLKELQC